MNQVSSNRALLLLAAVSGILVTCVPKSGWGAQSNVPLRLRESIPYDYKRLPISWSSPFVHGHRLQKLPLTLNSGEPDPLSIVFEASRLAIMEVPRNRTIFVSFPGLQSGGEIRLTEKQRVSILECLLTVGLTDHVGDVRPPQVKEAYQKYIKALFPFAGRIEKNVHHAFAGFTPDMLAENFKRPKVIASNMRKLIDSTINLATALDIYKVKILDRHKVKDANEPSSDLAASLQRILELALMNVIETIDKVGELSGQATRLVANSLKAGNRNNNDQIEYLKLMLSELVIQHPSAEYAAMLLRHLQLRSCRSTLIHPPGR